MEIPNVWVKLLYKEFKTKEQAQGEFRQLLQILAKYVGDESRQKRIEKDLEELGETKYISDGI